MTGPCAAVSESGKVRECGDQGQENGSGVEGHGTARQPVVTSMSDQPDANPSLSCLASRLAACDVRELAAYHRNRHTGLLRVFAAKLSSELEATWREGRCVLGGSLASDTAIEGQYDVDLRLLLRPGRDDPDQMSLVSQAIEPIIPFDRRLENTPDLKLAYHHKTTITVPGVPEPVVVGLNIQPEAAYFGLAVKSGELPEEVRDRYLVAKTLGRELGGEETYRAVKDLWTTLIYWLDEQGYFGLTGGAGRAAVLKEAAHRFPLFFVRELTGDQP